MLCVLHCDGAQIRFYDPTPNIISVEHAHNKIKDHLCIRLISKVQKSHQNLCPFAVYYLRYAVRSFFTLSRISLADGKRAGQKVQRKIAVVVYTKC